MPVLVGGTHDVIQELLIAGYVGARRNFFNQNWLHSLGMEEGAGALESLEAHVNGTIG